MGAPSLKTCASLAPCAEGPRLRRQETRVPLPLPRSPTQCHGFTQYAKADQHAGLTPLALRNQIT